LKVGDLARWLYRGRGRGRRRRPGGLARAMNAVSALAFGWGIAPNHLLTLEVRGRRTGTTIAFPLVMAMVDGERYLVAMLGEDAQWVRNVRAAGGRATIRCGRRQEVVLLETPVSARPRIIKAFLQRAPGARPHIHVNKDAPLESFAAIAASVPVFRIQTERRLRVR
jgi:hypothetical protein